LARACQDAIERDCHTISLHTSAADPLHELIVTAGGAWCTDRGAGGVLLVKLLDPPRWIEATFPLLRIRAKAAGISRPFRICFDLGATRWRLDLTRRSSRLVEDEGAAPDVSTDPATFGALLVGNMPAAQLRQREGIAVTDDETIGKLASLFPPALFWQSPFDALRS
jgi:hypothetical protein